MAQNTIYKLSELVKGCSATVAYFTDEETGLKLMEMGCLPGETVTLVSYAPMGDPIVISVCGYKLSLRKLEASYVMVSSN
jgi:ferrous iron transport protein A